MPSPYLNELVRIAREELPSLQYDLMNASTQFSLQAACQKMFDVLTQVVYHGIHESVSAPSQNKPVDALLPKVIPAGIPVSVPVARPVAAPVAPRLPAPVHAQRSILDLPPPPSISHPTVPPPSSANNGPVADLPVQPGITNVFVTSQGTQVVAPDGARAVLPPGAPVDLAISAGLPPELPPAPEGVAQVVLPPGGTGLSPEVAAALANRSNDAPAE